MALTLSFVLIDLVEIEKDNELRLLSFLSVLLSYQTITDAYFS